ncbi:ABC-type transport auxiliary lipoprotein family protein, partial [uncultured Azohydromonas sp.]|uniref:ABC-type transport auxiliary lipoprotein family protein n=1 Tax=uncultured Azohydromonas sp. TaxID=487342 RepID=UPI0026063FE3
AGTASAGGAATAAVPPDAAASAAPLAAPVLIVRRPVLPEYLLARRVRFRASDTVVDDWPGVFWAERIEVALTRELTAALRAQLPGWTLCEAECTAGGVEPRARTLRLEFTPLDYRRDHRELFTEVRAVLQDANGTLRQRTERRYTLQATADTPQAHAEVLGELLRRVAADVAPVVVAGDGTPATTEGR